MAGVHATRIGARCGEDLLQWLNGSTGEDEDLNVFRHYNESNTDQMQDASEDKLEGSSRTTSASRPTHRLVRIGWVSTRVYLLAQSVKVRSCW